MKVSKKYNETKVIFCLKDSDQTQDKTLDLAINQLKSYKVKLVLQRVKSNQLLASSMNTNSILTHMMKSDYDKMITSSCRFNETSRHVVQDFVNNIRLEIERHQIYDKLLESRYIVDILDQYQRCYINHQQFSQLIQIVLDYMALSKNYLSKNTQKLQTNFKQATLSSSIASRWLRLKNQIYFNNKDSLKILQYIFPLASSKSEFDHSFFDLRFDFSLEEVRKVASAVKNLCKYDMRTFCYLTNYLYISCIRLEQSGVKLPQIDSKLRSILKNLDEQNLPAPPFEGEDSVVFAHKDFKIKQSDYPHKYIDLSMLQGKDKVQALQNYIERRVFQAKNIVEPFNDLVKNICLKYGYHYLSSLKLKDKTERIALNRVIEKVVISYAPNPLQQSRQRAHLYKSIEQLVKAQYEKYENYIKEIINNISQPIQFRVSDLVRSKCMFPNVRKLNKCLAELKSEIEVRGYKIIEMKNRLRKKTSDVLIKLLIDSTLAEIQLAIDFKIAENEFNHRIYELRRSELFSPIALLKQMNERISVNYLTELNSIINSNLRVTSTHDYFEEINFQDSQKHFKKLLSLLPLQIDFKRSHRNQIDIYLMTKQVKRFADIVDRKIQQNPVLNKIQKLKRNGQYMYQMKMYEQAQKQLQKYCESFKNECQNLLNKITSSFSTLTATWYGHNEHLSMGVTKFQEHEKYLIKNYAGALHLISKINMDIGNYDKSIKTSQLCKQILFKIQIDEKDQFLGEIQKNIGWNSFKKGNYMEAIQNYEASLIRIKDAKGQSNMDYALILNNIGLVLEKQGNYNQSLKYYKQSLKITEGIKGKYSSEFAATLANIGLVYLNKGLYPKSIQIFQKCLQIEEKTMGKDSLNCAQTLNNLGNAYNRMGKSQQALDYYKRCLLIEENVKGKQYIDYAMILNNIGIIYSGELNHQQALKYYLKCLSIKQKVMGKSNIDLIGTLTNIGLAYASKGDYNDALRYYRRCLNIQQKTNSKDNIDYSTTLNNMAIVEKELGNYQKAIAYLEKAMGIVQNIEGKDSLDYYFLLSSLGEVYFDEKNYQYAFAHYQISLLNTQKIVGRQSLECAALLSCMGQICCKLGKYEQALRWSQESLRIKEKMKGREKIDCAVSLNNLAEAYRGLNEEEQAVKLYRQCLQLCENLNVKLLDYANACLGLSKMTKDPNEEAYLKQEGLNILMKLKPQIYRTLVIQMIQQ